MAPIWQRSAPTEWDYCTYYGIAGRLFPIKHCVVLLCLEDATKFTKNETKCGK